MYQINFLNHRWGAKYLYFLVISSFLLNTSQNTVGISHKVNTTSKTLLASELCSATMPLSTERIHELAGWTTQEISGLIHEKRCPGKFQVSIYYDNICFKFNYVKK